MRFANPCRVQPRAARRRSTKGSAAPRAPRIVFANRYFYPDHSASAQMLTDIANALAAEGTDVHVITSRQRYDDASAALPGREIATGVEIHRVWTSRFGRGRLILRAVDYATFYVAAFFAMLRTCRAGDTLVLKTDPPLLCLPGTLAAKIRRARVVHWLQDLFPEAAGQLGVMKPTGAAYRLLLRVRDLCLGAADANVALGASMAEVLAGRGLDPRRIAIIPNWADGSQVEPVDAERNGLRRACGLEGRFVVGYSGNLGRAHEFDTLLGAAQLLAEDPRIRFVVIGGGAKLPALRAAAAARGLPNIAFMPYQPRDRLRESLTLPDVHIVSLLPAVEGLIVPSKIYGVLAAGRPMIFVGSAGGEAARIIGEFRCGSRVGVGDAAGLAARIRQLADDPARAQGQGRAARYAFDHAFDFRAACRKWRKVLAAPDAEGGRTESPARLRVELAAPTCAPADAPRKNAT